ncbi:hypothetical protein CF392_10465 [Tamilnaduibacter salinus]|uniref:Uncharacterized protein n=1 Tax=Tamilnaduibacter salinus TaxID=1484056 RepID=A0A2A2I1D6_9GAMM|nr:hypothetical protein [Tamilnaduibacter salinus]PAV25549.1 hypothetical protein CF392_10465 [Tamilnaduibacter salinus]
MQSRRFHYGVSALKRSHTVGLLVSAIGLPAVTVAGLQLASPDQTPGPAGLWNALTDPGHWDGEFFMMAGITILAGLLFMIQKRAFVELTPSGMTLSAPRFTGVGLTGITTGQHTLLWQQIRAIRMTTPNRPRQLAQAVNQSVLSIETDGETLRLAPFHFLDPEGPDHRFGFWEASRFRKLDWPAKVRQSPLIQTLERQGYTVQDGEAPSKRPAALQNGFDLLRHKGMLTQLLLLTALGGYALFEMAGLTNYQALGALPVNAFLISGVTALALSIPMGKGAPRIERLGVGALFISAAVAATHPAMIRYALLTDPETERVTYQNVAPGVFEATGQPTIDLSDNNLDAYWQQFAPGDEHRFTLLRNAPAPTILDLRPLYERTRGFYQQRDGQ